MIAISVGFKDDLYYDFILACSMFYYDFFTLVFSPLFLGEGVRFLNQVTSNGEKIRN